MRCLECGTELVHDIEHDMCIECEPPDEETMNDYLMEQLEV